MQYVFKIATRHFSKYSFSYKNAQAIWFGLARSAQEFGSFAQIEPAREVALYND